MVKQKISIAILFACLYVTYPLVGQDREKCPVVQRARTAVDHIVIAMKRSDLEKEFVRDGGVSFRPETVYAYKDCSMLKIKVTFVVHPGATNEDTSQDTVTSVSQMYVEWPTRD